MSAVPVSGFRHRFPYVAIAVIAATCATWFAYSWRDPNYGLTFPNDDAMRLRNAVFIAVCVYWIFTARLWSLLAAGRVPVVEFAIEGELLVVTEHAIFAWMPRRRKVLAFPVRLRLVGSGPPVYGMPGTDPEALLLVDAAGRKVTIASLWRLEPGHVAALRVLLGARPDGAPPYDAPSEESS